jgi:hypothetical protein
MHKRRKQKKMVSCRRVENDRHFRGTSCHNLQNGARFLLVAFLGYSSTLKIEVVLFSERQ